MTTEFQQAVWDKLLEIPRGRVTTYGEIARSLGNSGAGRAVGSACGSNPHLVQVPCHRVVAGTGQVGNYREGSARKVALLEKEGIQVVDNRIVDFKQKMFTW